MSFPRYPAYKDSGVAWLGEVPGHWGVQRIKTLTARIASGKTPFGGSEVYVDEGITFLRSQNVYDEGLRLDDVAFISEAIDETMAVSRVTAGDILLNITGASIGRSCVVPHGFSPANVNQHVCVIRATKPSQVPFLGWSMKSAPIKSQIDHAQNGAAREGLNFDQIGRMVTALPSEQEQTQIAAFLDRETAKIDELVAEQRRLMELLKEKRQAVLSHAVTRGLNPNAPMKPSGIEWLGDVPGHWSLPKLKDVASFCGGGTPSRENLAYWSGSIPWVSPKDMKAERIVGAEESITDTGLKNSSSKLLPAGRVLMVVRSGILQHTIPVAINEIPVALNQDMKAIEFDDRRVIPDFFLRWVQGLNDLLLLVWAKQGATVESIEQTYLADSVVPMPGLLEQAEIVEYVGVELAKFDTLTTEAQRAIDLLQERRTALISAAVTGQIDVRHLAACPAH